MANAQSRTLLLFGATGDLSKRMLLPSLFVLHADGLIAPDLKIMGTARSALDDAAFREMVGEALSEFLPEPRKDDALIASFLERISYQPLDASTVEGFAALAERLGDISGGMSIFLSTAPFLFKPTIQGLKSAGLAGEMVRIGLEKPLGNDLASSCAINDAVADAFPESRTFRIDHYLGKETVQNLMALRFANALYEPLWNSAHIDHVQITVAESVGLEGRVTYYDKAGALRDMVQNHILQLLCLVAMEAPSSLDAEAVRDEKLKVLRSLKPITPNNVEKLTVRGQYRAGASAGGAVNGYQEELGATSDTETFVAIKAEINNWRWAGVPFYLRTGKRLATRMSEIVITFKPIPHSIFGDAAGRIEANKLVIRLQPDEGVKQWLMIKDPGPGGMRLRHVSLDMSFAQAFDVRNPDAYERLLMDVIRSNQTLFMRRDEVEAAWNWCDPILKSWEEIGQKAQGYTSGTWGPSQAIALIERDGRTWHEND